MFVLFSEVTGELSRDNEVNIQKCYASRHLVQAQPRPSGLEIQPAQYVRFRVSGSLDVVFKRAPESCVFRRSVEDLVPVRSEDPLKQAP